MKSYVWEIAPHCSRLWNRFDYSKAKIRPENRHCGVWWIEEHFIQSNVSMLTIDHTEPTLLLNFTLLMTLLPVENKLICLNNIIETWIKPSIDSLLIHRNFSTILLHLSAKSSKILGTVEGKGPWRNKNGGEPSWKYIYASLCVVEFLGSYGGMAVVLH